MGDPLPPRAGRRGHVRRGRTGHYEQRARRRRAGRLGLQSARSASAQGLLVDGEIAGFTEYRRRPGLIAFIHTLIDPRFEGQGLGSQLVRTALSEARSDGLSVLPFCPFVRS
jgi:predicted GNAT family acetyltransferase